MTTHTCIRILYCRVYPQLPPVIGAPWGCCGHASGIYSPRPLWFGGCATHATPCSVPGHSYFRMCLEKSERNCLTSYLYNAAILASFFFVRVFKGVVQMTLSRVIDKMVVDEGRALQPCRYRLFTHMSCIILYPYSTQPCRGYTHVITNTGGNNY